MTRHSASMYLNINRLLRGGGLNRKNRLVEVTFTESCWTSKGSEVGVQALEALG